MRSRTACFIFIAVVLLGAACRPQVRQGAPLILSAAHAAPLDYHYHAGLEHFARLLGSKTDGRVELAIRAEGEEGTEDELVTKVRDGKLSIAVVSSSAMAKIDPALLVLDLPYLLRTRREAYRVLDGRFGRRLSARLPARGIRNLSWWENGFVDFTSSTRTIRTPENLRGLRIAAPDSEITRMTLERLGAGPIMLSPPKPAQAIAAGNADGQAAPSALAAEEKMAGQKYAALTGHAYSPAMLIIGSVTYANLRPSVRSAVDWAASQTRDYERSLAADAQKAASGKLRSAGVRVTAPNRRLFVTATAPVYKQARDALGARLSDGAGMVNMAIQARSETN
jgi:tripartite ATP-independent transporter DctP family solute receptor